MITSIKRIVRSGFVGFWRSAFVSLSAIFVITLTLMVIGGVILFDKLLETTLVNIENKVDINVYTVPEADEVAILALKESIENLPDVREVVYVSREEALTKFRERHKDDELTIQALEELGENPLGATLSVRAREASQYESIAAYLEEKKASESADAPLIDRMNFNDNKASIEKLSDIIHTAERGSFITMIVLVVASVLIAFNTIRLTIYTSREEIGVMRLVGASNMFIRGPFVLQGVMYGIVSGVLTLLILYPVILWIGPSILAFFEFDIVAYFVNNFGYLFMVIVGSGVALGVMSSTLAIARYLRI